jgi:hypothetical protein
VFFSSWRAAVVSSSPERLDPDFPPITDELTSVLAFHGQHAFSLERADRSSTSVVQKLLAFVVD